MDDIECSSDDMLKHILQDPNSKPRVMQFEYLKRITNDFSDERLLGDGGFGTVYKGELQNGKMVAVKKIKPFENPDVPEMQFKNEVFALMGLRHPNTVRCVGYCFDTSRIILKHNEKMIIAESRKLLLCFEYLTMGSLDKHLKDESSGLDWRTCYKIINGVCCGLHYLHEECRPHNNNAFIIHLDLKPANILLDENMVPKVADFGLSKLLYDNKTQTCPIEGTLGYMAPEYINEGKISTKADIYSLGVVIIEIITGCKADPNIEQIINKWRNRSTEALSSADCEQIRNCLEIGKCCIKRERNGRPTMVEIIKKLYLKSLDCSLNIEEGSLRKRTKRSCDTPPENQEEEIIMKIKEHVEKLGEKSREARDKIELDKGNGMVATDKIETWLAQRSKFLVLRLYEALNARDHVAVQSLLAPDLEWWFHGPPRHQHMLRLLTGGSASTFRFVPRSVDALPGSSPTTVIAEGHEARCYWVHAWTVGPDGVITQLREYFNTDLTVTRLAAVAASASIKCVWQSQRPDSATNSLPRLLLALRIIDSHPLELDQDHIRSDQILEE